jgi:hypothetical protein
MSGRIRRVTRILQPQDVAIIDRGNRLAQDLAFHQFDVSRESNGRTLSFVGPVSSTVTQQGNLWSIGLNGRIVSDINIDPPFTFACSVFYPGQSSNIRTIASNGGAGTVGRGWNISIASSSDSFRFTFGGVADYSISTQGLVVGQINRICVVVTGNGGNAIYYLNGNRDSSRSVGTMLTPPITPVAIGAVNNGAWIAGITAQVLVGNVTIARRVWTDEDAASDAANPFQIFQPRRIFVPVAALEPPTVAKTGEGSLVTADAVVNGTGTGIVTGSGTLQSQVNTIIGTGNLIVADPLVASGGTITEVEIDGVNYRLHTFTSNGTFTVISGGAVDLLVVAGGGGGGSANNFNVGGGGAGGLLEASDVAVTVQTYSVVVGAGGAGAGAGGSSGSFGSSGENSSALSVTATGGGGGGGALDGGLNGGSGGGESVAGLGAGSGIVGQGNDGGLVGGGGGGRNVVGGNNGGNGGDGKASSITGTSLYYAGGGGGAILNVAGTGGLGGGGDARNGAGGGFSGTDGLGGGGGAGRGQGTGNQLGGAGGSGIVIIRYALPSSEPKKIIRPATLVRSHQAQVYGEGIIA